MAPFVLTKFSMMLLILALSPNPSKELYDQEAERGGRCHSPYTIYDDQFCLLFSHDINEDKDKENNRQANWFAARDSCKRLGGRLAVADDQPMMDVITDNMKSESAGSLEYWIGLNSLDSTGDYLHINGKQPGVPLAGNDNSFLFPHNWAVFDDGEAVRYAEDYTDEAVREAKRCVYVFNQDKEFQTRGQWITTFCERKSYYICELVRDPCTSSADHGYLKTDEEKLPRYL